MFKQYYIENWIMNIDTCGIGVFGLPLKALGMIISNMQLNYCATLEKMFILNPSTGLSAIWSAIEAFIDEETNAKIQLIKPKQFPLIQTIINKNQLEKKYGGELDDCV